MAVCPVYRFDGRQWLDLRGRVPEYQMAVSYRVLSYNIWFHGCNDTLSDDWLPRQQALLSEMRGADADFLCLQEVTAPFLELLLHQDWVRKDYNVSDLTGENTFSSWYGVFIASRVPVHKLELLAVPTGLGRSVLVAHLNVAGPERLAVATAHLESPVGPSSAMIRLQQLQCAMEYFNMQRITTGLFMGDFNVTDEEPMKRCWQRFGWTDLNDNSSTWFSHHWRPDRILLRSAIYACEGDVAEVIGKRETGLQVKGSGGIVKTPSDHFALAATLRLRASALPAAAHPATQPAQVAAGVVGSSLRTWSLENSMEAVTADSPLVFNSVNANGNVQGVNWMNVTEVVGALNTDPSLWSGSDCYVYSQKRKRWYKLWTSGQDRYWDLKQTRELPEVEPSLVFHAVKAPTQAVAMLNADATLWSAKTCYVYSEYYGRWYKLWAVGQTRGHYQ